MKLSAYFLPTLRETPSEATIASHRLMLRAGMIHQTAAGIYSWLPMGVRVLKKIEAIVREEQNLAGAQEVILPTIQPLELWAEGGRPDAMGKETLRMKDRHEREMLYAPTAEEVVTDLFRKNVVSYRNLPQLLYQIHWKFRDEIRPRFGVMRGREFLMKDCYSFDLDQESAQKSYQKMFNCYLKTFARMGLNAIPVKADSGAIGGDLSHEFQILASTGESEIFYDAAWDELKSGSQDIDPQTLMGLYAAADEMHDPQNCPIPRERLKTVRGIEVGHVFYLGTKYSQALNAKVADASGHNTIVHMGCYGIGVSRLIGAIIEAHHDDKGIIWPESVAPFKVGLINLRKGDEATDRMCNQLYETLLTHNVEVLYDDRDERAGVKFADMELIGLPYQLIVGPRGAANNIVELKVRKTGETQDLSIEAALKHIVG
jgi:prolyl-tRNA synthetase